MPQSYRVLICFSLSLSVAACTQSGPANRRPTKKVTVTVTQKGAPVEGANVTFLNQEGEAAPAYGKTDAQGKAIMKTYVEGDGAVVGRHKVMIEKSESIGGQNVDQNSKEYNPNAPPAQVKYHLPQKYSNPATSGLTAEVKETGANDFTFDLAP